MATSLPPSEIIAGLEVPGAEGPRPQCLSSDYGSEVNAAFPTALALDAAAAGPNQGFSRKSSRRVIEIIRRNTGGLLRSSTRVLQPDGNDTLGGRENTKLGSAGTAERAATEATSKDDGQRIAVPPASPRPSAAFSLRRKLSSMLGLGAHTPNGEMALDWKPHEKISNMLGYRPRDHGRHFTESYTMSGVLGMGGFGVVREGDISSFSTARSKSGRELMGWKVAHSPCIYAHRSLLVCKIYTEYSIVSI